MKSEVFGAACLIPGVGLWGLGFGLQGFEDQAPGDVSPKHGPRIWAPGLK